MRDKELLYHEVQYIRRSMGLTLNVANIDIIQYTLNRYGNISMEEIPLKTHGLHGMMVPPSENSEPYIVILNSNRNETEKRFDYTHELMHIALHRNIKRHFKCFDNPKQTQDKFIEWEANEGAAEFLLPYRLFIPVYVQLAKAHAREWLNSPPIRILSKKFNVTEAVVSNRIKSLNYEIYQYLHGIPLDDIEILSNTKLERAGWKKTHTKYYCVNCLSPINRKQSFCHICGQQFPHGTLKRHAYVWEGAGYMIFDGVKLNSNNKAAVCPNCGNEEILDEGEFCHICGVKLINMCDRVIYNDGERIGYCEGHKPLPGNERYCPYCGEKTTFFKTGVLKSWDEEVKPQEEYEEIKDDLLPF